MLFYSIMYVNNKIICYIIAIVFVKRLKHLEGDVLLGLCTVVKLVKFFSYKYSVIKFYSTKL